MEFLGLQPHRMYMTLHWGLRPHKGKYHQGFTGDDFSTDFHTCAVAWEPDGVVWYVDGVERFRAPDHSPAVPMYLIANLSVGGRWPGPPNDTTVFPQTYSIDYIRVYQRVR